MKSTVITTRYATKDDAALLAHLGAKTFSETFAADNTPEDMADYLAASFSQEKQGVELDDPRSVFFVAEVENTTAGYAHIHAGKSPEEVSCSHPIELVRLYAIQDWIGHGIGAVLMQACITEAQKRGGDVMWLGVWEKNVRAQAFYRKWGFVEAGTHVFMLGADAQTDLIMQRAL